MAIFAGKQIRRHWDKKKELWYFAVSDVIAVLTESKNPVAYWRKLKERLLKEGSNETVTNCHGLKMPAPDGKMRVTDTADTQTMLRLIQSIPSPKAEPFKLWLAKVGYERMQETVDPELAVRRGRKNWQAMGRNEKWIEQRMLSVETRNKLTDYWADHGIENAAEFAKLTNIIHQEWSGLTVKDHKSLKNLQRQNLRDHMSEAEIIFTALAELSTRHISEKEQASGYGQNETTARKGGKISGNARKALEQQTGKKIVSGENFLPKNKKPNISIE